MLVKLLLAIQLLHRPIDSGTSTYECDTLDLIPQDVYVFQQRSGVVRIPTTNLLKASVGSSEIKPRSAGGPRQVADGCQAFQYSQNVTDCMGSLQTGRRYVHPRAAH
jgi:hypothetical protein